MKKYDPVIWLAVLSLMMFAGVGSASAQLSCPADMVSYWKFDEGSGLIANDSVGGNQGGLLGAPAWTSGSVGGALSFDGIDDFVVTGNNPSLNFANQLTMEAWINISAIPGPFQWYGVTDKGKFEIYIYNGGFSVLTQGVYFVISGVTYDLFDQGSIPITPGQWTHVAATFDGTEIRAYVNGQLDFAFIAPGAIDDSSAYGFHIGREPTDGNHFNGLIDEVAVYGRALTQQEIQAHYQNGLAGLGYCDASQTLFADVPLGHWAYDYVMALYNSGITGGCSTTPPLFCPEDSITRWQMAVFMETSLGRAPAAQCTGRFSDVNDAPVGDLVCRFIEDFAEAGITGGCALGPPARFCPNDPVTRAQMAVFIEAALGAAPSACTESVFSDVTVALVGPAFCDFIEDFATRGITGGCDAGPPPRFCPNNPVTRGQMAVFLVAAPPPLSP
jgi:hypothetical protein